MEGSGPGSTTLAEVNLAVLEIRDILARMRMRILGSVPHQRVEIKVFLTFFAWWWKDPDPDPQHWLKWSLILEFIFHASQLTEHVACIPGGVWPHEVLVRLHPGGWLGEHGRVLWRQLRHPGGCHVQLPRHHQGGPLVHRSGQAFSSFAIIPLIENVAIFASTGCR